MIDALLTTIIILLLFMAFFIGGSVARQEIVTDCDKLKSFYVAQQVYTCEKT